MPDRWGRHPIVVDLCPSCGHAPAWHDAEGCTMPVNHDTGLAVICPCARTIGNLTETGAGGR